MKIASPRREEPILSDTGCDAGNPISVSKTPPKKCQWNVELAAKTCAHDPSRHAYGTPPQKILVDVELSNPAVGVL
jgi:hypothetical protein